MSVIFLDIDGVLSDSEFLNASEAALLDFNAKRINPVCVERLNRIVNTTGAMVVISSSWRIVVRLPDIRGMLNERGFVGKVISATPNLTKPLRIRGDEISAWLKESPRGYRADKFVILDDGSDMGPDLLPYLVKTDPGVGLTDDDADRAIAILNMEWVAR